jgi:hypothetical protein
MLQIGQYLEYWHQTFVNAWRNRDLSRLWLEDNRSTELHACFYVHEWNNIKLFDSNLKRINISSYYAGLNITKRLVLQRPLNITTYQDWRQKVGYEHCWVPNKWYCSCTHILFFPSRDSCRNRAVMWSSGRIKYLHLSSVKGASLLSSQPGKQTAKHYAFLPPVRLSLCRCILQGMILFFQYFDVLCIKCKNCSFTGKVVSICHYITNRKWRNCNIWV